MTNEEAIKLLSQIMDALLASNSWLPSTKNPIKESFGMAISALTAQPETHEKRTETHACDYISRKDAIDAHYEYCNKHPDAGFPVWSLKILEDLPSAQPEIIRCKDCKWKQGAECVRFADVRPFADDFCSRAERRTDE